jgi:hypothetical protein
LPNNLIAAAGGTPQLALQKIQAELDRLPKVEGSGAGQLYPSPELARFFESVQQIAKKAGINLSPPSVCCWRLPCLRAHLLRRR